MAWGLHEHRWKCPLAFEYWVREYVLALVTCLLVRHYTWTFGIAGMRNSVYHEWPRSIRIWAF